MKWQSVLVGIVVLGATAMRPAGGATSAQRCDQPPVGTQSGRVVFTPGVNKAGLAQHAAVRVSLFHCLPANGTRGSGTLTTTISTHAQTCRLFSVPTVLNATGKITWKNGRTSTVALVFSFSGAAHRVGVNGVVRSGLFAGHRATGQLQYTLLVNPVGSFGHQNSVARACGNRVRPHQYGRIAISEIDLHTTRPFVIT